MAVIPFRKPHDPWAFEPTRSGATLSSRIVEEVCTALFEKRLAPGERLGTEKDIAEQAGASRIVAPHDFVNETETPLDFEGHGTHVSGTIGQLTNDGGNSPGWRR